MDTASLDVGGSIEGKGDGARWGEVMLRLFGGDWLNVLSGPEADFEGLAKSVLFPYPKG
jgi:hypothetical protein